MGTVKTLLVAACLLVGVGGIGSIPTPAAGFVVASPHVARADSRLLPKRSPTPPMPTYVPPARSRSLATPTPVLPPVPPQMGDLAWLWFTITPDPLDRLPETAHFAIRATEGNGRLMAVGGKHALRLLSNSVHTIFPRFAGPPWIEADQGGYRLVITDPATRRIKAYPEWVGDVLSPDGRQMGFVGQLSSDFSTEWGSLLATQSVTLASRRVHVWNVVNNYNLDSFQRLLAWGPTAVYGLDLGKSSTFWWLNPNEEKPQVHSLDYDNQVSSYTLAFNPATDQIVFPNLSWISDRPEELTLIWSTTNKRQIIDRGGYFANFSFSPNGRWLTSLYRETRIPSGTNSQFQLRLYDLQQGKRHILRQGIPGSDFFAEAPGPLSTYYQWSPDSRYFLLISYDGIGNAGMRHVLVFRAADGTLLDDVTLPDSTGSLRLTNDLRLLAVAYQGDQAALHVYSVPQHQWYQPIPLGPGTPIIVWAP